jgi:biotin synthase
VKAILDELFNMDEEELFLVAKLLGDRKKKLEVMTNLIEPECMADPKCRYCKLEYYKVENPASVSLRTRQQIIDRTRIINETDIDRIVLLSGWQGHKIPSIFFDYVNLVSENTDKEIYADFGAIDKESLRDLKSAGMKGYVCSLQSPNEDVFSCLRHDGDSLSERINTLKSLENLDIQAWSGFLVGFGEGESDIKRGFEMLDKIKLSSISILPFIPIPHTKLAYAEATNPMMWARTVAIARILFSKADIFIDKSQGMYDLYSKLTGANGIYNK